MRKFPLSRVVITQEKDSRVHHGPPVSLSRLKSSREDVNQPGGERGVVNYEASCD